LATCFLAAGLLAETLAGAAFLATGFFAAEGLAAALLVVDLGFLVAMIQTSVKLKTLL
jgi:hypothetical protein